MTFFRPRFLFGRDEGEATSRVMVMHLLGEERFWLESVARQVHLRT